MALIDVAELLFDPMFVDVITITRLTQSVNDYGIVSSTSETHTISAFVHPGGGKLLDLLPESERGLNSIGVITTFPLIERSATQTDEITWSGKQWRVSKVNDYRNFGAGFVEAACTQKSPTE